ncbi:DciA family protein [Niveibacterium sp. SC-1]|uniref:DciA family protein n=1 Tax=Niveibacterium sp. SC-1 TaxID=3135646 RepID=UPI00311FD7F8
MRGSRPLHDFVGGDSPLARLQEHAQRLMRLQRLVQLLLPDYMQPSVLVANYQSGSLTLHTEGAAVAAKLKLIVPRLKENLWAQGVQVEDIKVKVRPVRQEPGRRVTERRAVDPEALDSLAALRASLPENSPLLESLDRFLTGVAPRKR